jgi:hypothetical protein
VPIPSVRSGLTVTHQRIQIQNSEHPHHPRPPWSHQHAHVFGRGPSILVVIQVLRPFFTASDGRESNHHRYGRAAFHDAIHAILHTLYPVLNAFSEFP